MKYAGIYQLSTADVENRRRCAAATRLAHYRARRYARRDGFKPADSEPTVALAHSWDGREHAVMVEIEVVHDDSRTSAHDLR